MWTPTFTLRGEIPISSASLMDLITLSHPFLREINSNFWGTSVSRLMFTPRRPFSYSRRSLWDKVKPLVVIVTVSKPGNDANEPVWRILRQPFTHYHRAYKGACTLWTLWIGQNGKAVWTNMVHGHGDQCMKEALLASHLWDRYIHVQTCTTKGSHLISRKVRGEVVYGC